MKKIIFLLLLMSYSIFSFELKFGLTKEYYEFRTEEKNITRNFGFSFGVVYNFEITNSIGVNFENLIYYNGSNFGFHPENGKTYEEINHYNIELDLPVYLNYKLNSSNNFHLGFSYPIRLMTGKEISDVEQGTVLYNYEENNLLLELLFGYEFIFNNISAELRYNYNIFSRYSNRELYIHKFNLLFGYKF